MNRKALYICLIILSILVIAHSVYSIVERNEPYYTHLKEIDFHGRQLPLEMSILDEQNIPILNNEQYLVIGCNRRNQELKNILMGLNYKKYVLETIMVSGMTTQNFNDMPVQLYSREFAGFFRINKHDNFILLLEKDRRIEFFKYQLIGIHELNLLLNRYTLE